ncbi:hypothetical protein IMX07_00815 [bacterium]|nr:hypothetical protein [bacterium]
MPWLTPADLPAMRQWAEFEIVGAALFNALVDQGPVDENGKPRDHLLNHLRLYRQAQLGHEAALGMTPAARMMIKATGRRSDFDLAAAFAVGESSETA